MIRPPRRPATSHRRTDSYLTLRLHAAAWIDACCPTGVTAWVACEGPEIISNAAMGVVPNHPAAWRAPNAIEESFFERRYVGDRAGPGLVARITLEHDDVVLWPPACFHPRVGEALRNPDLPRPLRKRIYLQGSGLWEGEGTTKDCRGPMPQCDEDAPIYPFFN